MNMKSKNLKMGSCVCQSLLFVALLLSSSHVVKILANSISSSSCHEHERWALLQFKHSFLIDCSFSKVNSWANGNCCSWDGVECDDKTGHVIRLDLSKSCLYGTFPFNSTLFSLTHLQHLNLAYNDFNHSQIPSQVGQLLKLRSLELYDSVFSGPIPSEISNLSELSLLDLSSFDKNKFDLKLKDLSLEKLVGNLTHLSILDLTRVDISSPVPNILTNLSSLTSIFLQDCNLYAEFPTSIFHLPHLQFLYLGGNPDLVGSLPLFQHNMPLKKLVLCVTSFSGELPPSIGKLPHLELLSLWGSHFSRSIPASLGNLTTLTYLYLPDNDFSGDIPSSLTNLTQLVTLGLSDLNVSPEKLSSWMLKLNKLTALRLSAMNLAGEIPSFLANLTSLQSLDLSINKLTGQIPDWLRNLTQLEQLYLDNNQLEGPIPQAILQLTNLKGLSLNENGGLYGNINTFFKLKNLKVLRLSGLNLTYSGSTTKNQSAPKFNYLDLQSCNLTEFPQFLHNQDQLQILMLNDNKIHGLIPQWFVNMTRETLYSLDISNNLLTGFEQSLVLLPWICLEFLDLGDNHLQGSVPIPPISMLSYEFPDNLLTGDIPPQICDATSLEYLDLSNNYLGGQVPSCISDLGGTLEVLNLRRNNLSGTIPHTFSCKLKMINLSQNQLVGDMPRSLANCSMLEVLDIGNNHVKDTFPSWLGILPKLEILVLRHNNFHGRIDRPKSSLDFQSLRVIDLSHNFHSGDITSDYIQNWSAMKIADEGQSTASSTDIAFPDGNTLFEEGYSYSITITNKGNEMLYSKILTVFRVMDFSSNNFTGRIPSSIGELRGLQLLNLSNNHLEGGIPPSLANIRDLESLDLSNNMLSGEIPQGLAQLTSLEVFNVSDNGLLGPIPQGRQFNTFDDSSFQGNSGLCGNQLSKKCAIANEPPPPPPLVISSDKVDDSNLIDWIIRSSGYVSGLVVGYVVGKYITDKNHDWFMETFGKRGRRQGTRLRRAPRRRS